MKIAPSAGKRPLLLDRLAHGNGSQNGNGHGSNGAAAEGESQVPALQRGLAVLELLSTRDEGATLSEIGGELGLSPASIFRIAGVLEETGYIRKDEGSRRFALTKKLLLMARPQHEGRSLVECALPAMREVLRQTGETVQLCTLADTECVMIEQLPSLHPFKYIVDIGSRPPVHCCAPGKAMLAHLPEAERQELVKRLKLTAHTEHSITTRRAFLDELLAARQNGYAVDRAEHFEGIHCVAAAILDRLGHPVAAITIAGPSARIEAERFAEFGAIMKRAARDIEERYTV
jgi:DNA-binding IclR family transcriptional regulator